MYILHLVLKNNSDAAVLLLLLLLCLSFSKLCYMFYNYRL